MVRTSEQVLNNDRNFYKITPLIPAPGCRVFVSCNVCADVLIGIVISLTRRGGECDYHNYRPEWWASCDNSAIPDSWDDHNHGESETNNRNLVPNILININSLNMSSGQSRANWKIEQLLHWQFHLLCSHKIFKTETICLTEKCEGTLLKKCKLLFWRTVIQKIIGQQLNMSNTRCALCFNKALVLLISLRSLLIPPSNKYIIPGNDKLPRNLRQVGSNQGEMYLFLDLINDDTFLVIYCLYSHSCRNSVWQLGKHLEAEYNEFYLEIIAGKKEWVTFLLIFNTPDKEQFYYFLAPVGCGRGTIDFLAGGQKDWYGVIINPKCSILSQS